MSFELVTTDLHKLAIALCGAYQTVEIMEFDTDQQHDEEEKHDIYQPTSTAGNVNEVILRDMMQIKNKSPT